MSADDPLNALYYHCRDYVQDLPEGHRLNVVQRLLELLEKEFISNKATTTVKKRVYDPPSNHNASQEQSKRPRTNLVPDVVPHTTPTNAIVRRIAPADGSASIPRNVPMNFVVHTTPETLLELVGKLSAKRHGMVETYTKESLRQIYDRTIVPQDRVVGLCLQSVRRPMSSLLGNFLGITTFALLCDNKPRRTFARQYARKSNTSQDAVIKNTNHLERALIAGQKALILERIVPGSGFLAIHCQKQLARLSFENIAKAAMQIKAMEDGEYLLEKSSHAYELLRDFCASLMYHDIVETLDREITQRSERQKIASPTPPTSL